MTFDVQRPLPLLGGLSAEQFMKRHWQRKPLLVRQAIPQFQPPVSIANLLTLAAQEDVESRLIERLPDSAAGGWRLKKGPFTARQLPSRKKDNWTLLVQGVDLHDQGAHELLQQFGFVPQARLDDLMISYATNGGGVGPHFDSYDVFLLQAHGKRRWRIGPQKDLQLQEGVPLKILQNFEPEMEWVLEPGDMLYLPPRYAHDGIAEGDCMTYSIGFRAPQEQELAQTMLEKLLDFMQDEEDEENAAPSAQPRMYKDPRQSAVTQSGSIPAALQDFALQAVTQALAPRTINQALGEYLTEPKPNVFFDEAEALETPADAQPGALRLSRKTRMMYDKDFIFINGESYRCSGKDARLLQQLADERRLPPKSAKALSAMAQEIVQDWCDQGWLIKA